MHKPGDLPLRIQDTYEDRKLAFVSIFFTYMLFSLFLHPSKQSRDFFADRSISSMDIRIRKGIILSILTEMYLAAGQENVHLGPMQPVGAVPFCN